MGLVAAKCTQCGASIEVDESKEAGICSHFGTAFITEKVINNYHIHNTTNVTNNIENATINVKSGDDAGDLFKRYGVYRKQGKTGGAIQTADKMEEKFPEAGIAYYCIADLCLSVINYDVWLEQTRCVLEEPIYNEKPSSYFLDIDDDKNLYDYDKLESSLDKLDKMSDDEICAKFKEKCDKTLNANVMDRLAEVFPEIKILDIFGEAEPDYGSKRFGSIKSYFNAVHDESFGYWGRPISSIFCAKKMISMANDWLTDADRESYGDFIRSVDEKFKRFEAIIKHRDTVKHRLFDIGQRLYKEYKAPLKGLASGETRVKKNKKIGKIVRALIIIAVIAVAAVVIIKKFL